MEVDPFLQNFDSSDLKIAEEFLTRWLPFLTRDLCESCSAALHTRIRSLNLGYDPDWDDPQADMAKDGLEGPEVAGAQATSDVACSGDVYVRDLQEGFAHIKLLDSNIDQAQESPKARMSWADMAQEDEGGKEEEDLSMNRKLDDVMVEGKVSLIKSELSREQRERIRFANVGRKKDFVCFERLNGRVVNILEGLELHTSVFSAAEQKRIVDFVYNLQEKGRNNEFGEHTYSEPRKWMRGKGRVTIQFGCCYNYAERNGTPPGILRSVMADPIPNLLKILIKRLIGWHVMPTYCVPDSCIVNIYEPGDCIPPHIDSHDFVRPFCTVSFLSECNILFGSNLKIAGPGDFIGSISIPLPLGSVLVLKGNGADVAKHCVPAVPSKRISITFRKMEKVKWPHGFRLEPDLENIKPYGLGAGNELQNANDEEPGREIRSIRRMGNSGRHGIAKGRSHHRGWTEEPVERSLHRGSSNHRRRADVAT